MFPFVKKYYSVLKMQLLCWGVRVVCCIKEEPRGTENEGFIKQDNYQINLRYTLYTQKVFGSAALKFRSTDISTSAADTDLTLQRHQI